jgi:putative ABC transport system permease protein
MNLRKIIKVSLKQVLVNGAKSLWAIAGLSTGVGAVITMVAIGNGAKDESVKQLEKSGTNLITINSGKVKKVMERRQKTDLVTTLRMSDCIALVANCHSINEVVPSIDGNGKVKSGNIATNCMINGVSASYFNIKDFSVEKGNLFTSSDDNACNRVVVLGGQLSRTLFGNEDPTGKILLIKRIPFIITGVLKPKGVSADGANLDLQAFIPVNTALRRIYNVDYLTRIYVKVNDRRKMAEAENEIETVLRNSHKLDQKGKESDFTIDNQQTDLKTVENSSASFTWLIAGVSAISLFIGSIGILAVMLLSVKERNSEIGLRLSVGARRQDIVTQFLTESAILGFAGGIAGIVISLAISVTGRFFTDWHIVISPLSVIISLVFSLAVGLASGALPAQRASRADPISALQKE